LDTPGKQENCNYLEEPELSAHSNVARREIIAAGCNASMILSELLSIEGSVIHPASTSVFNGRREGPAKRGTATLSTNE
jgi:hypothetical protein